MASLDRTASEKFPAQEATEDIMGYSFSCNISPAIDKTVSEDFIGLCRNCFWLLDGASIPAGVPQHPQLNTLWYVNALSMEISRAVMGNGADCALSAVLEEALSSIGAQYSREFATGTSQAYYPPSSTIILIRANIPFVEYLVLGDSSLLILNGTQVRHVTDARLRRIAAALRDKYSHLLQSENREALSDASHRLAAEELAHRNRDGGYWIAALEPEAARHAICGTYNLMSEPSSILAMSDGLAAAHDVFSIYSSWLQLATAVTREGIGRLISQVRRAEEGDPLGERFLRSYGSDDASGFLLEVSL